MFSGLSSVSTVPAGKAAKAALVGANTVNGPGPFKVSTKPAALTAATRVVWSLELTALSMMSLLTSIGAPPTIGLLMPLASAPNIVPETASAVTIARVFKALFMVTFLIAWEKRAQRTGR